MLDGLMVYGDHYDNAPLLEELHTLLKDIACDSKAFQTR